MTPAEANALIAQGAEMPLQSTFTGDYAAEYGGEKKSPEAGIQQAGINVTGALHSLAALINAKGDQIGSALGGLLANLGMPELGGLVGGAFSLINAVKGLFGGNKPLKTEVTNRQLEVVFADRLSLGPETSQASMLLGGRARFSGTARPHQVVEHVLTLKDDAGQILKEISGMAWGQDNMLGSSS